LNYRGLPSDSILNKAQFDDPSEIQYFLNKKLNFSLNTGYPFAQIIFDTILYSDRARIYAKLNQGPFIFNGAIVNEGDTSINSKLIAKFLRFKVLSPFSNEKQKKLPFFLQQIPFAEAIGSPRLEFFGNQAIVHLDLRKRKTNSFTGILGLLPQSEAQGGTIVTGNIDANLNNLFNKGLGFFVKWNRFAPSSQMADIKLSAPVLNYSGLGLETNFALFRQDSTINRQRFDFRISTSPGGVWKFQIGYSISASSGPAALNNQEKIKISTNAISLSFIKSPFQAPGVLLKKRAFQLDFLPTLKQIDKRESKNTLPQLNYDLRWKFPIELKSDRFVIQTITRISGVLSNQISLQDQLRSGGNQSTRGFNENEFYASQLAEFTIQPQYLVDKTILVGVFSDLLLFNSKLNNQYFFKPSKAFGFGIALELDFGSNSVQLSIANGILSGNPIDLQTTKIHFGYVARI